MSATATEGVELIDATTVRVLCRDCGTAITLQFGDLDRAAAEKVCQELDRGPRHCPGFHVELSGFRRLWRLDEALEAVYGPKGAEVPA